MRLSMSTAEPRVKEQSQAWSQRRTNSAKKPAPGVFPCAAGWTSLATLEQFAIAAKCTAGARSLVPRDLAAASDANRKGDPHPWLE